MSPALCLDRLFKRLLCLRQLFLILRTKSCLLLILLSMLWLSKNKLSLSRLLLNYTLESPLIKTWLLRPPDSILERVQTRPADDIAVL